MVRGNRGWAAAVAALVGLGAAAPAAAAGGGWAQAGYDAANGGYNPVEDVLNAGSVDRLRPRWRVTSPTVPEYSCINQGPPVLADGRAFHPDQRGFAALAAGSGRVLWRHDVEDPMDTTTPRLAVAGGLLVAASSDCQSVSDPNGTLAAYDARSGVRRWQLRRDAPMHTMVVAGGLAIVSGVDPSTTAEVTAYRVGDGRRAWAVPRALNAAPVAAGGRLLLTREDAPAPGAVAVSARTGRVLWQTRRAWEVLAADPAGGTFYAREGAALLAVRADSGRVRWSAPVLGGIARPSVAADGRRVFVGGGAALTALAAASGRRDWSVPLGGAVGRPTRAGGLVYAAVAGGALAIRAAATGRAVPGAPALRGTVGHAVVADGTLYAADGVRLAAYRP
ncbi:hypothetical protein GCM10010123_32950 [Pilimelia anulata]|uniref:Pyrrolo-quinoline quinone repeat domain-containing protein n=1 Tax=Pilimelia anulata TaxID=53371 RepID=A0A8J3FB80_9ACTN|nr:PQQ-binding-like beta-propeller repeat protein [Pilimelia anulata]GGK00446.1 hypothetical protein GCM10010123_32950 [Pilimelia anulata]